jgi:hypothetical protein
MTIKGLLTADQARQNLQIQNDKVRGIAPVPLPGKKGHANRGHVVGGKRADLDNKFFRSRAEANYARFLNLCIERGMLGIHRWEYEPQEFKFPIERGQRFYTPDFKVILVTGEYEWHEVKGWMDDQSKTKIKRFKKYHPQEAARWKLIDSKTISQIRASFSGLIPFWETGVDTAETPE